MKGTLYRPDMLPIQCGKLTLTEAQNLLAGYIEIKYHEGQQVIMNEDGRLLNLPYNSQASEILGYDVVGNIIIGNVLD